MISSGSVWYEYAPWAARWKITSGRTVSASARKRLVAQVHLVPAKVLQTVDPPGVAARLQQHVNLMSFPEQPAGEAPTNPAAPVNSTLFTRDSPGVGRADAPLLRCGHVRDGMTASAPAIAVPPWTAGAIYYTSTHAGQPRDALTLRTA